VEDRRDQNRIGVLVVAYNAAATLAGVLDRLPKGFRSRVAEIAVFDDASSDCTYMVGLEYQKACDLPLTVVRRPQNLGYGGNQKAAYRWAIDRGLDIVVLLHGDGQYAPEVIEDLVDPLESMRCDAVFGSRMMEFGTARMGSMPLYKYVGNRILTKISNSLADMSLTEWHSGYRAYRVDALKEIPFENNSDGFDFDTQIILQLHEAGKQILEVPIPTYYGDEICYVNGIRYAKDVVKDVVRYRMHKTGFGSGELAFAEQSYESTWTSPSHRVLIRWLASDRPKRILDVGCSNGRLGELLRLAGHTVIGVDSEKQDGLADRLDGFVEADLNQGLPEEIGEGFDVVVATETLSRLREPAVMLTEMQRVLRPGGVVMVSVPNISHWYPRIRVASGRFQYEKRGIFDRDHVRFFTSRTFEKTAAEAGLRVRRRAVTGFPVQITERGGRVPRWVIRSLSASDKLGIVLSPTLFSYLLIYELDGSNASLPRGLPGEASMSEKKFQVDNELC